jgi:5-methylcytosine-specific restriction endonuclease McrA
MENGGVRAQASRPLWKTGMGYCDHTSGELIALTREKRREASRLRLRAKYGETIHVAAPSIEYAGPHWYSNKERLGEAPAPKKPWKRQPTDIVERALRRHAKKEERRNRPPPRHVMRPEGPHEHYVSQTVFEKLRRFQENRCYLCPREFTPDDDATQDHVVPRAKGGKNAGNILLAHARCNTRKGDRLPTASELAYLQSIKERFAAEPQMPPDPSGKKALKVAAFAKAMDRAKRERLGFWRYWWSRLCPQLRWPFS